MYITRWTFGLETPRSKTKKRRLLLPQHTFAMYAIDNEHLVTKEHHNIVRAKDQTSIPIILQY